MCVCRQKTRLFCVLPLWKSPRNSSLLFEQFIFSERCLKGRTSPAVECYGHGCCTAPRGFRTLRYTGCVNEWVSEWVSAWVWMSEGVGGWVSAWPVTEWMRERFELNFSPFPLQWFQWTAQNDTDNSFCIRKPYLTVLTVGTRISKYSVWINRNRNKVLHNCRNTCTVHVTV